MARFSHGPKNRNRRRIAAVSLATFLALLGYEAGRLHAGADPALARSKTTSASTKTEFRRSEQSTTTDGGGYYTPPAADSPSTGSS